MPSTDSISGADNKNAMTVIIKNMFISSKLSCNKNKLCEELQCSQNILCRTVANAQLIFGGGGGVFLFISEKFRA